MPKALQRDPVREANLQTLSILVLIAAMTTMAAMTYVQNTHVPAPVEIALRSFANLGGLFAVPVTLVLGSRNWFTVSRSESPAWRNGLALSAIVLTSLVWVSHLTINTVSAGPYPVNHVFHVDPLSLPVLFATLLYSTLLAGLLAFSMKGKCRLLVLSAVTLLWAGLQSGVYF